MPRNIVRKIFSHAIRGMRTYILIIHSSVRESHAENLNHLSIYVYLRVSCHVHIVRLPLLISNGMKQHVARMRWSLFDLHNTHGGNSVRRCGLWLCNRRNKMTITQMYLRKIFSHLYGDHFFVGLSKGCLAIYIHDYIIP